MNRSRLSVAWVVFVALCWGSSAHAINLRIKTEPLRLDIIESLFASYRGDLGSLIITKTAADPATMTPAREVTGAHFYSIVNRLNAILSWRKFRLATRFDTALFFDPNTGGQVACGPDKTTVLALRSRFCQNYFYLEKISAEYADRDLEVTLGDFYVNFGRGIVLSLRKVDELGIDTTLLGGRFVYHKENVVATLVAGVTNVQNVDEATGRSTPDPYDVIAGARVEYRIANKVILGIHQTGGILMKNFSQSNAQQRKDGMMMYGGTIDVPRATKWLSLFFEADGQMRQQTDSQQQAYAIYGSATAYAGPLTILVEVKHYSNFQRWVSSIDPSFAEFKPVAYNAPPTAERVLTELTSTTYDVTGPRLRLDWRVNKWLLLYASTAYFEDRAASSGTRVYHDPYGGAEFRWNKGVSHLFVSGGYRLELCAPDAPSCQSIVNTRTFQTVGHLEWDFTQHLPKNLSIESQGYVLFRQGDGVTADNGASSPQWQEGNAYVALKWTPRLVFVGGWEFTTRPSTMVNQHFFNGSVQWNITTASSIRLFAGGMRGGLRCISGVCRDFPSFTGARLEVVVRL